MAHTSDRLGIDHHTLMQVERTVEDLGDQVKELTREVDGIEVEPNYTCDCSCDGTIGEVEDDIQDLYRSVESLTKRVEALEEWITKEHQTRMR